MKNDSFLKACRKESTHHTPIWLMRQAGRYMPEYRELREKHAFMELCKTPELASEITLMPVEEFGFDAAIIFSDIMMPLLCTNVGFELKDNIGPVVMKPLRDVAGIKALRHEGMEHSLSFVFESIKKAKRRLHVPLIGFAGAPFTLASYMIEGRATKDFRITKELMHGSPEAWSELMEKLADLTVGYLAGQIKAGADVVQLFDSWVGCLDAAEYKEHVLPHSRRIFDAVRKLGVPSINFSTGTSSILRTITEAGGDVISIDWRKRLGQAWKEIGYDHAIQGNLDPEALRAGGAEMERQSLQILNDAAGHNGHVFNLGHGVLPDTKTENVRQLVEIVHDFDNASA